MKKLIYSLFFGLYLFNFLISTNALAQEYEWIRQGGGSDDTKESSNSVTTDTEGNVYIAGSFDSSVKFGSLTLIDNPYSSSAFVVKYDKDGNEIWARKIDGCAINQITTDISGNVYVTGEFGKSILFANQSIISAGKNDIFLAKFDNNGNELWAKQGGGSNNDGSFGISVDNFGNILLTGLFRSADILKYDGQVLINNGWEPYFLLKLDNNGRLLWFKLAGNNDASGQGVCTDLAGNSYVIGYFSGTADFDNISLNSIGGYDIFVAKYDADGKVIWAERAGGFGSDVGRRINKNSLGYIYITGEFNQTANFDDIILSSNGVLNDYAHIFIAKYNSNGDALWAKEGGSDLGTSVRGISVDLAGNSYITGSYLYKASFFPIILSSGNGVNAEEVFIIKYDTQGNLVWGKSAGGYFNDNGSGIVTDKFSNVYVTGNFAESIDLQIYNKEIKFDNISLVSAKGKVFLAKIHQCEKTPIPRFSYTKACAGGSMFFTDLSTEVDPNATYFWDFGDGTTSNQRFGNIEHKFGEARPYTVQLIVSQGACSDIYQTSVIVSLPTETKLEPFPSVSINARPFPLLGGLPEGGNYSGNGVINNQFYPQIAGVGVHTITYTLVEEGGCISSTTAEIEVREGVLFTGESQKIESSEIVLIPIKAENFTDISGFEFEIKFPKNQLEIIGYQSFNADLNGFNNQDIFSTEDGKIKVLWYEPNAKNITLSFLSTLFYIKAKILTDTVEKFSLCTENTLAFNNTLTEVKAWGACVELESEFNYSVSGKIITEDEKKVKGVSVLLEAQNSITLNNLTSFDGEFNFKNIPIGSNIKLIASKNLQLNNGVSQSDLVVLNRHILGIKNIESPYKIIAGDVLKSNSINVGDLVLLNKIALGFVEDLHPQNTSWRFVPSSYVFPNVENPFVEEFPESITIDNIVSNQQNQDFIAIKVGDLTYNRDPNKNNRDDLVLTHPILNVGIEEEITIPVYSASGYKNLIAWQTTFNFDTSLLKFIGFSPKSLAIGNENFNLSDVSSGNIHLGYYNRQDRTESFDSDKALFELKFKVIGQSKAITQLGISSVKIPSENYDYELNISEVKMRESKIFIKGIKQASSLEESFKFYPNPAKTQLKLDFYLPKAQPVKINLYNLLSQKVESFAYQGSEGKNQIQLDVSALPTQAYYLQLETSQESFQKRLIIMR